MRLIYLFRAVLIAFGLLLHGIAIATDRLGAPKTVIISETVGQVGDHVVTSREVQINQRVEGALWGSARPGARKSRFISPTSPFFSRSVQDTLIEWAIYLEAQNLGAALRPMMSTADGKSQVLKKLKTEPDWRELEVTEAELEKVVQRKILARSMVQFKADASGVTVSDVEAEQYFQENRERFGNLPFENFRKNIVAFLKKKQIDERMREWFELLRVKYQIRNFKESSKP